MKFYIYVRAVHADLNNFFQQWLFNRRFRPHNRSFAVVDVRKTDPMYRDFTVSVLLSQKRILKSICCFCDILLRDSSKPKTISSHSANFIIKLFKKQGAYPCVTNYTSFVRPRHIFAAISLSGNISLKSATSAPAPRYELCLNIVSMAHITSVLATPFVNR